LLESSHDCSSGIAETDHIETGQQRMQGAALVVRPAGADL